MSKQIELDGTFLFLLDAILFNVNFFVQRTVIANSHITAILTPLSQPQALWRGFPACFQVKVLI